MIVNLGRDIFLSKIYVLKMRKEEIASIAQLLTAIKDNVRKLKKAQKEKDGELLESAKHEILMFQKEVDKEL